MKKVNFILKYCLGTDYITLYLKEILDPALLTEGVMICANYMTAVT